MTTQKWSSNRKKRVDWTDEERQQVVEAGGRMLFAGVKPHPRYVVKTLLGPAQEVLPKERRKGKTSFAHQPTVKKLLAAMRSEEQRIRSQAGQVVARPPEPLPAPVVVETPVAAAPSIAVLLGQQLGVLMSTAFATAFAQPEVRQALDALLARSEPQETPRRPDPTPEPPRVPEPKPEPAEPTINGSVRHNPLPRPERKHDHKPKPKVLIAGLPSDRHDKVARALNGVCKPVFWSDKISGGSGDTSNAALGRAAGSCPVTFALTELMSHGSMYEAKKHAPDFRTHAGGDSTLIQNIRDWVEKEYNKGTPRAPDPQPIAGLLPCL